MFLSYEGNQARSCGKSAASSDGKKCDGYTCRNEKSDKAEIFCNAQFCSGSKSSHSFIYKGMDVTTEEMIWHMSYVRGGVDKYRTCIPKLSL